VVGKQYNYRPLTLTELSTISADAWLLLVCQAGPMATVRDIDFLLYNRAAGSEPDAALTEEHWSYMDQFADGMVARGPTLAADRVTWTGSLHIVALRSADAAREFVEREPYNRASLFHDHVIRRFKNMLGRTMWDFPHESVEPRFVVIAHLVAPTGEHPTVAPRADFTTLQPERLIVYGELFTLNEAAPAEWCWRSKRQHEKRLAPFSGTALPAGRSASTSRSMIGSSAAAAE
jgi:uncharacterized protein